MLRPAEPIEYEDERKRDCHFFTEKCHQITEADSQDFKQAIALFLVASVTN